MVQLNASPCVSEGSQVTDFPDLQPDGMISASQVKDYAQDGDDLKFVDDGKCDPNAEDLDPEVRDVSMETPMSEHAEPPDGGIVWTLSDLFCRMCV